MKGSVPVEGIEVGVSRGTLGVNSTAFKSFQVKLFQ